MKNFLDQIDELTRRLFADTRRLRSAAIVLGILGLAAIGVLFFQVWNWTRYVAPTAEQASGQASKSLDQIIKSAEDAVREDPQNPANRVNLAGAYLTARRFEEALAQVQQAKVLDKNGTSADFVLGIALNMTGKYADSIDPLQRFIDSRKDESMAALDTQLQGAYFYQGDSYLQLGQFEKAIVPLEKTVSQVGTDSDSILKLGQAYLSGKRYDDALAAFERVVAFVPAYAEAYEGMSKVYTALGRPVEASYAEAMVLYCNKQYDRSLEMLSKVNSDLPTFSQAFTGTGLVCEAQKKYDCAFTSLQAALKLNPGDLTAEQAMLRVKQFLGK